SASAAHTPPKQTKTSRPEQDGRNVLTRAATVRERDPGKTPRSLTVAARQVIGCVGWSTCAAISPPRTGSVRSSRPTRTSTEAWSHYRCSCATFRHGHKAAAHGEWYGSRPGVSWRGFAAFYAILADLRNCLGVT